jgi:hypothetical protein
MDWNKDESAKRLLSEDFYRPISQEVLPWKEGPAILLHGRGFSSFPHHAGFYYGPTGFQGYNKISQIYRLTQEPPAHHTSRHY